MYKTRIIDKDFLKGYLEIHDLPFNVEGEFVAISTDNLKENTRELLIELAQQTLYEICEAQGCDPVNLGFGHEYFLIKYEFLLYMILTDKIEHQDYNNYLLVAIDGNCCAGKTYLAKLLKRFFNGIVLHMDDYFLPKEKYTEELDEEIGGNIDVERLIEEVFTSDEIIANKFDCETQILTAGKNYPKQGIIILEGTYSLLEEFKKYIDYSILLTLSPQNQKERLLKRESEESMATYDEKWLPKERKYLNLLDLSQVNFYINSQNIIKGEN